MRIRTRLILSITALLVVSMLSIRWILLLKRGISTGSLVLTVQVKPLLSRRL
jgi:hypothetical protein